MQCKNHILGNAGAEEPCFHMVHTSKTLCWDHGAALHACPYTIVCLGGVAA